MLFTKKSFSLFVVAALAAVGVTAQDTTTSSPAANPTAGLDTCIITCVTGAASSAGCSSFEDLTCVCTSTAFQSAALACLQANCTADDLAAAQQLQATECASVSPSGSGTPSGTATSGSTTPTSPGSTSSSSSSSSPSATKSNAASALKLGTLGSPNSGLSFVAAALGVVAGALVVV